MSELLNKLNQYRSMGDKFYPEDIVVTEDIWALIDEIERLNNIIKEVREYIEEKIIAWHNSKPEVVMLDYDKIIEILNKGE